MRSGQVYQPTTASLPHDRNKTWATTFLAASNRGPFLSKFFVLLALAAIGVIGLVMIIYGATSYHYADDDDGDDDNITTYIVLLCLGVVFQITAILALILYYRHLGYSIPFCPSKIARIRKHLHVSKNNKKNQHENTNEPVSAQYCPPSAPSCGSSPPTAFTDVSEQQHLMEEKPETGDENERILEEDPRIVLSPLKSTEEF